MADVSEKGKTTVLAFSILIASSLVVYGALRLAISAEERAQTFTVDATVMDAE